MEITKKILKMDKREIIDVLVLVGIVILGTYLFAFISYTTLKNEFPKMLEIWNRWDTPHYLDIARDGYETEGDARFWIVFLPLYPYLIRFFFIFLQDSVLSALVVSNIAYIFAAFYLYKLASLDYSKDRALLSVFYFSIFPTAYFLHVGYTESLFLALAIASFYYARVGKWFFSGLLGMFASATRITGMLLLPALALEYLYQKGFRIKKIKTDAFWLLLVPVGFFAYLMINYVTFGNPLQFTVFLKEHWFKSLAFPWKGFADAWSGMFWREPAGRFMVAGADFFFGLFGLLMSIYVLIWMRLSYGVYMLLTWLLFTSTSFLLSTSRYTLALFPIFIVLSAFSKRESVQYSITLVSILLHGLFLILFTQGQWAF